MGIINEISDRYTIPQSYLTKYLHSAPHRYKVFKIPKRNGGERVIAQPAKALKQLQKLVLKDFFIPYLPVHDCATAYIKGRNIQYNVEQHVNSSHLLKMDFADFFPSILSQDFIRHSSMYLEDFSVEHEFLIEKLFFRKDKGETVYFLSAGAPSSPFISNTLMYRFDTEISAYCSLSDISYTRYADDLAFSSDNRLVLSEVPVFVSDLIGQVDGPTLSVNKSKTILVSKKDNRHLTGLVLTNDGRVSLGRNRKRLIRAMIHRYSQGELPTEDLGKLRGLLSFASSVERSFYESMREKYSDRVPADLFF